MQQTNSHPGLSRLRKGLIAAVAALCLLLTVTATALANTARVFDNAHILDVNQVQSAASSLKYRVDIYTTDQSQFSGTKNQFDTRTMDKVRGNSDLIVMAISKNLQHMYIAYGTAVPLSGGSVDSAVTAFKNGYNSGGYTQATINSLQSLRSAVGSSSSSSSYSPSSPSGSKGGGINFGLVCLIGLLVLGGIALFVILRRRGRGSSGYSQPMNYDPSYNQYNQYPQGQYPPNYGPGYPQQGQGMNPWAAGGLGAAAGGLLGYELGRHAGQHEAREEDRNYGGGGGDYDGGNDIGGGGGGDFVGGDFGSGGGDFGGGGGDF